ncbi:hypothetical protein NC653_020531 [Populus alba x Populus x berolinensis]|uniref:Uncharacterized protein n=1 Tax=Populus alba x Populus x berolinensis TaxID=444605 RepID=A0AAD6MLD4_9ROSI|nr:hypothetical protein NC653_020531 [Populus alba x Populus x berolinensis]
MFLVTLEFTANFSYSKRKTLTPMVRHESFYVGLGISIYELELRHVNPKQPESKTSLPKSTYPPRSSSSSNDEAGSFMIFNGPNPPSLFFSIFSFECTVQQKVTELFPRTSTSFCK